MKHNVSIVCSRNYELTYTAFQKNKVQREFVNYACYCPLVQCDDCAVTEQPPNWCTGSCHTQCRYGLFTKVGLWYQWSVEISYATDRYLGDASRKTSYLKLMSGCKCSQRQFMYVHTTEITLASRTSTITHLLTVLEYNSMWTNYQVIHHRWTAWWSANGNGKSINQSVNQLSQD